MLHFLNIKSDEVIAQLANAEAQVVSAFPDDEGDTADFTPGRLNMCVFGVDCNSRY